MSDQDRRAFLRTIIGVPLAAAWGAAIGLPKIDVVGVGAPVVIELARNSWTHIVSRVPINTDALKNNPDDMTIFMAALQKIGERKFQALDDMLTLGMVPGTIQRKTEVHHSEEGFVVTWSALGHDPLKPVSDEALTGMM